MSVRWTPEMTVKFVEEYRCHECLWNPENEDYKKRPTRDLACRKIPEAMHIEGFDLKAVRSKIKIIRSTYWNELAKIEKSKRSGASADSVYKPKAPWFAVATQFLFKVTVWRESQSNIVRKDTEKENEGDDDITIQSVDVEVISNESHEQSEESPIRDETDIDAYSPEDSSLKPPVKKFRSKTTPFSSRSLALGDLEASSHATNEKHTEFDVFGSSVAAQLNNMPWENAIELQLQIQQLITRPPFELVECGEDATTVEEHSHGRPHSILESILENPRTTDRNINQTQKRPLHDDSEKQMNGVSSDTKHLSSADATRLKTEMQQLLHKKLRIERQNDGGASGSTSGGVETAHSSSQQFSEVLIKEEVSLVDTQLAKSGFGDVDEQPIIVIKQENLAFPDEYNPLDY